MTVPATFTSPVVTPGLGAVTIRPGIVVAALLFACLIKGLATTQGVMVPPDPDTVRDLGFIQGFLDGNWFGDPATADAWMTSAPSPSSGDWPRSWSPVRVNRLNCRLRWPWHRLWAGGIACSDWPPM